MGSASWPVGPAGARPIVRADYGRVNNVKGPLIRPLLLYGETKTWIYIPIYGYLDYPDSISGPFASTYIAEETVL
jgi:hypothetical protein